MRSPIAFFLNLLMLVVLLKIFAPGLADQLIDILGKVLTLASAALDTVIRQQDPQSLSQVLVLTALV